MIAIRQYGRGCGFLVSPPTMHSRAEYSGGYPVGYRYFRPKPAVWRLSNNRPVTRLLSPRSPTTVFGVIAEGIINSLNSSPAWPLAHVTQKRFEAFKPLRANCYPRTSISGVVWVFLVAASRLHVPIHVHGRRNLARTRVPVGHPRRRYSRGFSAPTRFGVPRLQAVRLGAVDFPALTNALPYRSATLINPLDGGKFAEFDALQIAVYHLNTIPRSLLTCNQNVALRIVPPNDEVTDV